MKLIYFSLILRDLLVLSCDAGKEKYTFILFDVLKYKYGCIKA